MRITIISVCPDLLSAFIAADRKLARTHPGACELRLFNATSPPSPQDAARLPGAVANSDFLAIDLSGAPQAWTDALAGPVAAYEGDLLPPGHLFTDRLRLGAVRPAPGGVPIGPAGPGAQPTSAEGAEPERFRADLANLSTLLRCFHAMTPVHTMAFLTLLLHEYGGHPEIAVTPAEYPGDGIVAVDLAGGREFTDVRRYAEAVGGPGRRQVALVLHPGNGYPIDSTAATRAVVEALGEHCWVLPLAVRDATRTVDDLRRLMADAGIVPDVVVNMLSLRLGTSYGGGTGGAGAELLDEWGAAHVHPILLTRITIDDWLRLPSRLSPAKVMVSMMLPELDGCIDEIPVAAMSAPRVDERYGVALNALTPIPEQVDRLAGRVAGLLRLRRLDPAEARVAIIGYDYPAGESRLLGGSFLDVAASMSAVLAELARTGYRVGTPGPDELLDRLLARAVNSPRFGAPDAPFVYPRAQARADLGDERACAQVDEAWPADGPSAPMTTPEGDFIIPALEFGNALVGIQPGRGGGATADAQAHDKTAPPHPQYLAFYTWLQKVWRPDVIVHVGTHGTMEFLGGKENAVSTRCYPDIMMGSVPHVYLYYAGNPAEGLIAVRRSHAQIVSHQPVAMVPGGLHDTLAELDELVAEYRRSLALAPATSAELLEEVRRRAEAEHLPTDPDELESRLDRLAQSLTPMGLHVFGRTWTAAQTRTMVHGALGHGTAELPPAVEVVAEAEGLDPATVDELPRTELTRLRERATQLIDAALDEPEPARPAAGPGPRTGAPADGMPPQIAEPLGLAAAAAPARPRGDEALGALAARARELRSVLGGNDEWEGLHRALTGRHLTARLGGDVIRDPRIMPSGHGIYQFDPRRVPTPVAWRRGERIAADIRAAWRAEHDGADPRCVGVVLWGLETTRTQGEAFAQVLSLLGARPAARPRPGRPRFEPIPAEELTAPRVDVVVTICGFFRDLFSGLIDELDELVATIAALDEPDEINPVAASARALRGELIAGGRSADEAGELASSRIFGPASSYYGTGMTGTVEAGEWDDAEDLAREFAHANDHVYSRRRSGERVDGLYAKGLARVEVVSQVRSSNEYAITDLDHYFEYLGGFSAAVVQVRGERPMTLVADTSGAAVHTSTAGEATADGLRTRLFNPDWQDAMLAHRHRGGTEIAKRVTNLVGLAAMTGQVGDWMFDEVFDRYLADERMRERLVDNNPHAAADIAQRLTEASERGLWSADEDRLDALDALGFDLEAALEGDGTEAQ